MHGVELEGRHAVAMAGLSVERRAGLYPGVSQPKLDEAMPGEDVRAHGGQDAGEARWLRTSAKAMRAGMPAARASAVHSDALQTQWP